MLLRDGADNFVSLFKLGVTELQSVICINFFRQNPKKLSLGMKKTGAISIAGIYTKFMKEVKRGGV